ncbi:MAG TPA: DNA-3-methyladenine glycosylase I [Hyphomonadaceae bacterium]|nr:DNA-3-methyladenine glycosylase I [Hyphomonadaceae bacterium]
MRIMWQPPGGKGATYMVTKSFDRIEALAGKHHGGPKGLAKRLGEWEIDIDLAKRKDARLLAGMAKAVFSSGFSWQVIEKKWPGFETAFDKFDPKRVAAYGDEDVDRLLKDTGIVRNGAKIMATIENARFVVATAKEHGSFAKFLAGWPETDQVGLMEHLKKHASRLGGATVQYFLRFEGWDAFILSQDVVKALIREGVVSKQPTSKKDMAAVQAAFNTWREDSGRPVREISRILALSVGPNLQV